MYELQFFTNVLTILLVSVSHLCVSSEHMCKWSLLVFISTQHPGCVPSTDVLKSCWLNLISHTLAASNTSLNVKNILPVDFSLTPHDVISKSSSFTPVGTLLIVLNILTLGYSLSSNVLASLFNHILSLIKPVCVNLYFSFINPNISGTFLLSAAAM